MQKHHIFVYFSILETTKKRNRYLLRGFRYFILNAKVISFLCIYRFSRIHTVLAHINPCWCFLIQMMINGTRLSIFYWNAFVWVNRTSVLRKTKANYYSHRVFAGVSCVWHSITSHVYLDWSFLSAGIEKQGSIYQTVKSLHSIC